MTKPEQDQDQTSSAVEDTASALAHYFDQGTTLRIPTPAEERLGKGLEVNMESVSRPEWVYDNFASLFFAESDSIEITVNYLRQIAGHFRLRVSDSAPTESQLSTAIYPDQPGSEFIKLSREDLTHVLKQYDQGIFVNNNQNNNQQEENNE